MTYHHNYPSKGNQQLQFTQPEKHSRHWLSPPLLSVPDWSPQYDAYATSPISSPGIYTPAQSDSWNYFDTNFKEIETSPLATPMTPSLGNTFGGQSPWNPVWPSGLDSAQPFECLPLPLIQEARHVEDPGRDEEMGLEEEEGEAGNEKGVSMHTYSHSRSSTSTDTFEEPSTPRKANWGTAAQAQRSSGARRSSTRTITRKESSKPTTKNTRQLRSTTIPKSNSSSNSTSKPKPNINPNPTSIPSPSSPPASSARTSHNAIEKQYRMRLNNQFSILLDALPPDIIDAQTQSGYLDEKQKETEKERKISKGEVLILARQYIEELERTKMRLEKERKALLADVGRLKGAWLAVQSRDGDIRGDIGEIDI